MKITVNVLQKNIDDGIYNSASGCPIALALKEQHPRNWQWLVKLGVILRWPGRAIPMPDKAIQFSTDFFYRKPVQPFSFELEIPEE